MTTIRDVASRAAVSITTVSHVINGTRRVEPATEARVRAAIAELGFRPNALARSMRGGRTYTFGLLLADVSNPFFADLARVVTNVSFDRGYNVMLCNSDGDPRKEERYLEVLLSKQIDGIAIISTGECSNQLQAVVDSGVPLVIVDRELDIQASQVMVDNFEGGFLAGTRLLELGHRRIGVITGPKGVRPSSRRLDGIREALEAAGVDLPDEAVVTGDFRYGGGRTAMAELLARRLGLTAVFAGNDVMAMGALQTAHDAGLSVPADLSIMGFDDIAAASGAVPRLTTIAQPVDEMARTAIEFLLVQVADRGAAPQYAMLPVSLVERMSCAAPATV